KGDAVEVDVSEQQFRNVDPDAPVESFSFAPLPDTFEDLFSDTDNIVHVSEVLHDLHRDCNFRYALFAGLFTNEELDWLKSDEAPFSDDVELTLEDLIIDNV
ncbi:unnamed protein product, partial [Toxocara canis]|uniref:Rad21_Rec8 domain-containing protein n=1 Tax=Toxocara canis TaxID=6265 RepID=A0A183U290_TOXCA